MVEARSVLRLVNRMQVLTEMLVELDPEDAGIDGLLVMNVRGRRNGHCEWLS